MRRITTKMVAASKWLKSHAKLHTVVAVLVFLTGLVATLYYWNSLRQSVRADIDAAYARQVRSLGTAAAARMQLYETVLRGSAGLFTIHTTTNQADWDKFHQPYDIRQKYPDIQFVGVGRYVPKDTLDAFYQRRMDLGDAGYSITPAGDRPLYVPIVYEAAYAGHDKAQGFDMYTDPVRRSAMERALQVGSPSMTGPIDHINDAQEHRTWFLLYSPLYRPNAPTETEQQRRQAVVGFAYIGVDMKVLLDDVISDSQSAYVAFKVEDAETGSRAYESTNFAAISSQPGMQRTSSNISLYGQPWRITFATSPDILSARERQLPDQAMWRGLLTCIFFAGLVWYLITDRERKYARQKQQEVQTAKDDLLSLASHQLRTPATVVKQYVGMLLQGYGGSMSRQQKQMLTSAYESNERQLEIINQLLYVARLDAGRITLHKEKVSINSLLKSVARDQAEMIREHKHHLEYAVPRRSPQVWLDPHYTRMVLENLLSNAIKYTPEGGTITLGVYAEHDDVVVSVTDTGVGIESAAQTTIFEKFSRVENELSTDVNGSGVGLYLTQQIITLHGGVIEVSSVPGKGSTFRVRLPKDQRNSKE